MRALAMTAVALCACDPVILTEHHQVQLTSNLSASPFFSGDSVLVGTRVCPTFERVRVQEDPPEHEELGAAEIRRCYAPSLRGPATADDACFTIDAPGGVEWVLARVDCEIDGSFSDDLVRFEAVALEDVRGAFTAAIPLRPEYVEFFRIEAPAYEQPGVVAAVGEPLRMVEGSDEVRTDIVTADSTSVVAVSEKAVSATVVAGNPDLPAPESSSTVWFDARAGDAFTVTIDTTEGELEVGEVRIVARSEIHSLELFPEVIYYLGPEQLPGVAAVAVTRDREGRVLREPPVTWSVVDGPFELDTFDADGDGVEDANGYASVRDACAGAEHDEAREVTLEGRIDDFRESVVVRWTCPTGVDDGCACRSAPAAAMPWLLPVVLLLRRRRRAAPC